MNKIKTVGSVCSGIEAASVAWLPLGFEFNWFSEIASFPSNVLKIRYPKIDNLGDVNKIPSLIENGDIKTCDLICGGTPCQAFSVAGLRNGLNDERGNLTLKFIDVLNANDKKRKDNKEEPSIMFWENVEGVLTDKTNAFGCFIFGLAGFEAPIVLKKWPNAGVIKGPKRNVAWRVLDAKYFGIPQQRKRLYVLAGGKNFYPENVLYEKNFSNGLDYDNKNLIFKKHNVKFQVFRNYTDCLYSAYGTKWNGNAPAYNGSLFIVQNDRIRRISPLESERLMGFPDNYTLIKDDKNTPRYQAVGNSWAVPVIKRIGESLILHLNDKKSILEEYKLEIADCLLDIKDCYLFDKHFEDKRILNTSSIPSEVILGNMKDIVDENPPKSIYISPVGCKGMLRRSEERKINMNLELKKVLTNISNEMSQDSIDRISKKQKRGRFSK